MAEDIDVPDRVDVFLDNLTTAEAAAAGKGAKAAIDAAIYAMAVSCRSKVSRVLFVQDLAAALDRRHLYPADVPITEFWAKTQERMENILESNQP